MELSMEYAVTYYAVHGYEQLGVCSMRLDRRKKIGSSHVCFVLLDSERCTK